MLVQYTSVSSQRKPPRDRAGGIQRRDGRQIVSKVLGNHKQRRGNNDIIAAQIMTELTLTAIYEEAEEGGYIGYVAELPGANTQGETLEEVRENLGEAIQLILEANREEFERHFSTDAKVTRERLVLRAA